MPPCQDLCDFVERRVEVFFIYIAMGNFALKEILSYVI